MNVEENTVPPISKTKKILGNILFVLIFMAVMLVTFFCTSCASDTIGSPCPNYGEWCDKTPINSWTTGGEESGENGANP